MRARTITVDISRGGDAALRDYRRQSDQWWARLAGLRCTIACVNNFNTARDDAERVLKRMLDAYIKAKLQDMMLNEIDRQEDTDGS